jgi:hypothetical protein
MCLRHVRFLCPVGSYNVTVQRTNGRLLNISGPLLAACASGAKRVRPNRSAISAPYYLGRQNEAQMPLSMRTLQRLGRRA